MQAHTLAVLACGAVLLQGCHCVGIPEAAYRCSSSADCLGTEFCSDAGWCLPSSPDSVPDASAQPADAGFADAQADLDADLTPALDVGSVADAAAAPDGSAPVPDAAVPGADAGACLPSQQEAAESNCVDQVDDDCDGLTDCGDPDCEFEYCDAAHTALCHGGGCGCDLPRVACSGECLYPGQCCADTDCGAAADVCLDYQCVCGNQDACAGSSDTCQNGACRCGSSAPCAGSADTCVNGACRCGNADPCTGSQPCVNGGCLTCGKAGTSCCLDGGCAPGAVCIDDTCKPCGAPDGPCCANGTCSPGGMCVGGECAACGAAGEPCCPYQSCPGGCCIPDGTGTGLCLAATQACSDNLGGTCDSTTSGCGVGVAQCGAAGQSCCLWSTTPTGILVQGCTAPWTTCGAPTCEACGVPGGRCCPNGACQASTCQGAVCLAPQGQ